MVSRRPLVIKNGLVSELLQGDTVSTGGSTTEVIAGSGLVGGGTIGANTRLDFAVAPNSSGLIYAGDSIGNDGVSFVNATTALSSGNAALADSADALASGNAALSIGAEALASGNAALGLVPTLGGGSNTTVLEAASAVASGVAVGVDDTGRVQTALSYFETGEVDFGGASSYAGTNTYQLSPTGPATNCCVITGTNKAVFFNRIGTGYMNAVVGEWNGTSWSFGTYSTVYSQNCQYTSVSYNPNTQRILVWFAQYSGSTGTAYRVFSVSGTTITSEYGGGWSSNYPSYFNNVYLADVDRHLVEMNYGGTKYDFLFTVGVSSLTQNDVITPTTSLTGISFYEYDTGRIVRYDFSNTSGSRCCTYTITPTSITQNSFSAYFGTSRINSVWRGGVQLFSVGNRKFVIILENGTGDPYPCYAYVGTIDAAGTSITFGPEITLADTGYYISRALQDTTNNGFVVGFSPSGAGNGYLSSYKESGGSLTKLDTSPLYGTWYNTQRSAQFLTSNGAQVTNFQNTTASNYAYAAVVSGIGTQVNTPLLNGQSNILGVADSTVASGTDCTVVLPGSIYNDPNASYTPGKFYYADVATSGLTVTSTQPSTWSGAVNWNYLGKAITTSGLLLINSL